VYRGTLFGTPTVRIHQITVAVDSGNPDGALRLAETWRPTAEVPAERRSHYFIDVARAWADTGAVDEALDTLIVARGIAPEHIRSHPDIGRLLRGQAMEPMRGDRRWLELRRWLGESPPTL
jgi:hypothetical protein